jgi:4-amino-4-deoxy-L-arabinose transferase-like glycosyltransferase
VNPARQRAILLLMLGGLLFFANTWGYDLWPADEPRFAQVAREMLQSGDWLSPHVNGQPYKEKPPLLFWAIAAVSAPFGDVTEFTARVPSGVAALATLWFTYLLAARLYGRRCALWSVVVLMTGYRFWWQARTAQIDMLLTACLTAALYAYWMRREDTRFRWLALFYGAIIAAVYSKGPVGVIFPLLMIPAFRFRHGADAPKVYLVWGLAIVAATIALWLVPARMAASAEMGAATHTAIGSNLFRQTVGRFFLGVSKQQPPWYYLVNLPLDWFPWTLLLPWALPWIWRRRKDGPETRLLLAWIVPAFVFFSICAGKRAIYLLPIFPAMAILFATAVLALIDGDHPRWRKGIGYAWACCLLAIGAAPFVLLLTEYRDLWNRELLVVSLCAFGFGADTLHRTVRTDMRRLPHMMASHFAGMALLCAIFAFPVANTFKSARAFCQPLRLLSESEVDYRLYSVCFSREEYMYYAKHFHDPFLVDEFPVPVAEELEEVGLNEVTAAIRSGLAKATLDVPVATLESVTDAELDALAAAATAMFDFASVKYDWAPLAQGAAVEALAELRSRMDADGPAFMLVQEKDWRWLLALDPKMGDYAILKHESVGSRDVVLVANEEGAKAVSTYARCDLPPCPEPGTLPMARIRPCMHKLHCSAVSLRQALPG